MLILYAIHTAQTRQLVLFYVCFYRYNNAIKSLLF